MRVHGDFRFWPERSRSFLLFGLLKNWIDNLLSSEEMPHPAPVELISKGVEDGVENGVCLCENWKHLWAETSRPYLLLDLSKMTDISFQHSVSMLTVILNQMK